MMEKVKNVKCNDGYVEMFEDLRFDNLLKTVGGVSKSFRVRDALVVNKGFNGTEMEYMEPDDINFAKGGKGGSLKNVKRKKIFKSDSKGAKAEKHHVILDRVLRKTKNTTPKTMKKFSEIGAERSEDNVRDVTSDGIVVVAEYDSLTCKSIGQPFEKINCDNIIDESIKEFLGSLDKYDKNLEFILETSDRNVHHEDDDSCSDLKILSLDDINEGDYTPFVPSTQTAHYGLLPAEESRGAIRTSSQSQFREKLMALVGSPFDQNELNDLWRKITERKSKQDGRHPGLKFYSTKTREKSRLDWYQDLKVKIEEFRSEPRKVLYLLRGFFFWLENTAHEDAFMPWLDYLYLNALG